MKKQLGKKIIVAENRKARFNYALEEFFEAGIVLLGTEVKSLRDGKCSIAEAYATVSGNEIVLLNSQIETYSYAHYFSHQPKRERKLLLHKREVNKIIGAITRKGYSLIPLSLFFNSKGLAKIDVALAKGKSKVDKREDEKKRDWQRAQAKIIKSRL